jgi:hypothetical protein
MTAPVRLSTYGTRFAQVYEAALEKGKVEMDCGTEKLAMRTRFRFYGFLKAIRKDKDKAASAARYDYVMIKVVGTKLIFLRRDLDPLEQMLEKALTEAGLGAELQARKLMRIQEEKAREEQERGPRTGVDHSDKAVEIYLDMLGKE